MSECEWRGGGDGAGAGTQIDEEEEGQGGEDEGVCQDHKYSQALQMIQETEGRRWIEEAKIVKTRSQPASQQLSMQYLQQQQQQQAESSTY